MFFGTVRNQRYKAKRCRIIRQKIVVTIQWLWNSLHKGSGKRFHKPIRFSFKSIIAYVRLHTKDVFQNCNTSSARHLARHVSFPPWNINVAAIKVHREEAEFFFKLFDYCEVRTYGKVAHKIGVYLNLIRFHSITSAYVFILIVSNFKTVLIKFKLIEDMRYR